MRIIYGLISLTGAVCIMLVIFLQYAVSVILRMFLPIAFACLCVPYLKDKGTTLLMCAVNIACWPIGFAIIQKMIGCLSFDTQKEICISMVTQELNRLKSLGYTDIKCDENAITALFLGGYSTKYGARQLRDFIQEQISNAIITTLKDNKQPTGVLTFSKKQHSLVFLQTANDSEPEVKDPTLFLKWFFHLSNSREH